jgi:CRISPR-associated protein Csd1
VLLQSLYRYATQKQLLDNLPFQRRTVHLAIPIRRDGTLRGDGLVLFTTKVLKGKSEKDEIGREVWLPRFPGENNGGKAYYLAEHIATVLGIRKDTVAKGGTEIPAGATLPADPKDRKDRNPVLAYRHFWERIEAASGRVSDERLRAILEFRRLYLTDHTDFARGLPFLAMQQLPRAKGPELCVRTEDAGWQPIKKVNTVQFEVEGCPLDSGSHSLPNWRGDPLWEDWAATYPQAYVANEEDGECKTERETLCLVTGETGQPIARSHKPKILGVPGLASGGYVVSFARESPAFSSYGFEMGENAPVSEPAAAAYALALNELLASDDCSFSVGEVAFCFWAEKQTKEAARSWKNLATANPKVVAKFLKSPFAGIDHPLAKQEEFSSIALSANAGRVVVREWVRTTLEKAILSMKRWFEDLQIGAMGEDETTDESKAGPYSLFRLAAVVVRDSKELKRVSEVVTQLYWAAIDQARSVPLRLLQPVLAEFQSALLTDSPRKPRYPFNRSRFALIKLILKRNTEEGGFMPGSHLAVDSPDQAYNAGRLLAVFARLQKTAHEGKLEGPGVVERYYGAASSAPANVFAVLWKLHFHHLRKLEQRGKSGVQIANAYRGRIGAITSRFPPDAQGTPGLPTQLSLEEQGRFALGFYQQDAYERTSGKVRKLLKDARKPKTPPEEVTSLLRQAERLAQEHAYPDLVEAVALASNKLGK